MIPAWLRPIEEACRTIGVHDLTRFTVPEGHDARPGAVLMLFGETPGGSDDAGGGEEGGPAYAAGTLLLTERAHDMRSHPGQVSFPGGSLDPGETREQAALREAREEVGLDTGGVEVFGQLPELWLPPSNFAVRPVVGWWADPGPVRVASPAEVHAIHRVRLVDLVDPAHRVTVRHPSGFQGPGFLIGEDHDVVLWGFTGGIIATLLDYVGWSVPWDTSREHPLPDHMLAGGGARRARAADSARPGQPDQARPGGRAAAGALDLEEDDL